MTVSILCRVVTMVAALFFGAVAIGIWVAPSQAAHRLGLEMLDAAGSATLGADLGGLFAGMAMLLGIASWTRRPSWNIAAALLPTFVAAGRVIDWLATDRASLDVTALTVELCLVAVIAGSTYRSRMVGVESARSAWRRGAIAATVLLVTGGVASAALMNADVEQMVFDRAARQRAGTTNTAPLADDALRIAICGSSAPLASAGRAKACVAVFAGGKFYVVDAGPESVENLLLWGVPLSSIGGVLLTHFHSDHIGDLGELNLQSWAAGRPAPLAVYGGPGVERVVAGFNQAYGLDQGYRTAHHTDRLMPATTWPMVPRSIPLDGESTSAKDRTGVALDDGALKITAIEVDHAPIAPAYAYRFDYKGRSVLITGDLKHHAPLARAARGVDVLVSEAIAVSMTRSISDSARSGGRDRAATIMHDIEDYHLTPQQAAQIANEANAKLLVFYHLLPAPDGMLARRLFAQGVADVRRGDWTIADDGSLYTMPIGTDVIRSGRMSE